MELFEIGNRKTRRAIRKAFKKYYHVDIGKFKARDEKYIIWHDDGSADVIEGKMEDDSNAE